MSTPTINQYILNLFAKSRLAGGGTQAQYGNLKESEVTFGKFVRDAKTGKWSTSITCKSRGWTQSKLTFNTGTLKAFIGDNLQSAGKLESLERLATFPSIIFVDENQSIYLNVEKDANIFDALQMTGYTIPTDAFNVILNKDYDMKTLSSGFVDIDHAIVSGRMLLRYINREPVVPVKPEETKKEEELEKENTGEVPPLSEEEQIEAMLKADAEKEAAQANGENSEGNDQPASEEPPVAEENPDSSDADDSEGSEPNSVVAEEQPAPEAEAPSTEETSSNKKRK
jgi:hypothetical protein